jgi:hypothetical protein
MTREKEEIDLSVLCLDIIYAFNIEKEEEKKSERRKIEMIIPVNIFVSYSALIIIKNDVKKKKSRKTHS